MFSNPVLSVVIGLVFVYLIYSLLGSIITEIIATNFQLRNFVLKHAIKKMLNDGAPQKDKSFGSMFFNHPLTKALSTGNFLSRSPSYIKSETFAKVVTDLLRGKNIGAGQSARAAIENSIATKKLAWDESVEMAGDTEIYLQSIWADAQGDVDKFNALLAQWFTEMMDRSTGWYKKYTQYILFGVGLTIAVAFNVDTITIATKLHDNPQLQEKVIVMANDMLQKYPDGVAPITNPDLKTELSKEAKKYEAELFNKAGKLLGGEVEETNNLLGLGWGTTECNKPLPVAGWILTALAISFGAPFWFDLLNKLMQFRGPVATKTNETPAAAPAQPKTVG